MVILPGGAESPARVFLQSFPRLDWGLTQLRDLVGRGKILWAI